METPLPLINSLDAVSTQQLRMALIARYDYVLAMYDTATDSNVIERGISLARLFKLVADLGLVWETIACPKQVATSGIACNAYRANTPINNG